MLRIRQRCSLALCVRVTPSKLVTEGSSTLLHTIIRLATACLLCVVLALCAGMALADSQNPTRPRMAPAAGFCLVAAPKLRDPSFARSVVLLLQTDSDGALGLVMNQPSSHTMGAVLPDRVGPHNEDQRLFIGGPVDKANLLILVRSEKALDPVRELIPGLAVTGSSKQLDHGFADSLRDEDWRVFAGYSGWGPGQLESEIARGDWFLLRVDVDDLLGLSPEVQWQEFLRRASGTWASGGGCAGCGSSVPLAPDLVKQSVGGGILVRSLRHFGRQVPIGALDAVGQQLPK